MADTIADERFSSFFGFTDEEVRKLLENTGNLEYFDWIKKWYDGYCFGKTEIYCPWDVLCYLNKLAFESESEPENFWENESIFENPKCRDYGYFQEKCSALV